MNFDVIAVGPHPDDIEIGCGGTLINLVDAGYKVGMVDLTEAMLSTRGDRESRFDESNDALKIIGAAKRFQMGFFEGSLASNPGNIYELVALVRRTRPYVVLAPYWDDRHPDHVDASRLVQTACFWSGVSRYGDSQTPHRPHRLVYYFIHREGPVSFVVDISADFDRKLQAVRAYHSQFLAHPGQREMTYISRPEFLERIINRARYYGSLIGAEYGEPFFVREMNRVTDLVSWVGGQGVVG